MAEVKPTALMRVLGMDLHARRTNAKLTLAQVAEQFGCSTMTISRYENGKSRVPVEVLPKLLDLYGAPSTDRNELLRIGERCRDDARGWWEKYPFLGEYVPLEDAAYQITEWAPHLIPGLLQTPAYAASIFSSRFSGWDLDLRVEARMRRQQRIDIPRNDVGGLILQAFIDESVLYRTLGDEVMLREQLIALRAASERDNVVVEIVPFAASPHVGLDGPCVLMSFAGIATVAGESVGHAPIVVSDTLGGLSIQNRDKSRMHSEAATRLRTEALRGPESLELLDRRIAELPHV